MPQVAAPALLLGEGLTLLGAVRCFGRAGISAYVVTGPDPLARHSRWFRNLPAYAIPPHDYAGLPELLSRIEFETAVLVPCSDPWASAVAGLEGDLAKRFPSVVSPARATDVIVDKARLGRLLAEAKIPHPRTYALEQADSLDAVPNEVLSRSFLKPRDSVAFAEAFGTKAFDFSSRTDAAAKLRRAQEAGLAMVLQEYIPGGADNTFFVDGVVDHQGGFPVLFARKRLRIFPPRFGNSTSAVTVPLAEVDEAVASLKSLALRIGLRGIFSAEFKRDQRDGRLKLIEVNPRPWWYVEFAANCGADVCVPAYLDALGLPIPPAPAYRVDARLVYPYYDWLAWRHISPRTTTLTQLMAFWTGAAQPEWCNDDPLPAVFSLARETRGWLGRRIRRLVQGRPT